MPLMIKFSNRAGHEAAALAFDGGRNRDRVLGRDVQQLVRLRADASVFDP
jgi:hypothetical protein